jgi:hypothetical protein
MNLEKSISEEITERNFAKLTLNCRNMCLKVGVKDFVLTDLIDPDLRKTRHIFTELAKFTLFRMKCKEECS